MKNIDLKTINFNKDKNTFPNQRKASKEVIQSFLKGVNWCLLLAEMQSGKTGTFLNVAAVINSNPELLKQLGIDKDNIYLLTGMNEISLIKQFTLDMFDYTKLKNNIYGNAKIKKITNNNYGEYKKIRDKISKNSLIIIDESHWGSDKKSTLDNFYNSLGINSVTGINPNNIHIISVSATPFAENNELEEDKYKGKIFLENTSDYYGIIKMFQNNKVKQSCYFGTNKNPNIVGIKDFVNIITTNYKKKNGYVVVRLRGDKVKTKLKNLLKKQIPPILFHDFDSESAEQREYKDMYPENDINDQYFNIIPEGIEVIFINGMIRAGKRINTSNILMVHDTCITSKTDVTVQSLLGRCCGYNKNENIDIYVDLEAAKDYEQSVRNRFNKDFTPNSKNVSKTIELRCGFSTRASKPPLVVKNNLILFKTLEKINAREKIVEYLIKKIGKNETKNLGRLVSINHITETTTNISYKKLWDDPYKAYLNKKNHYAQGGSNALKESDINKNIFTINVNYKLKQIIITTAIVKYSEDKITKSVTHDKSIYKK